MKTSNKNKKYWFKAKSYGYGWTPASIEGWVVVIAYLICVTAVSVFIGQEFGYSLEPLLAFLVVMAVLTAILLYISYKTGEKPEWRWGKGKSEKKEN